MGTMAGVHILLIMSAITPSHAVLKFLVIFPH